MWGCANKIGWRCDGKHSELTKLACCSPFPFPPLFIWYFRMLFHTQTASLKRQYSCTSTWGEMLNYKEVSLTYKKEREWVKEGTLKGGGEKFRAWRIEHTATFHHQNSNEQLLRKKKSPEPCRFVSEGEKPVVRSNRPLIFLSCIKETILLGWYTREQALLIFTVYLMLFANVYMHLSGICPRLLFSIVHEYKAPLLSQYCVCACRKNYNILLFWQGFPGCHKPPEVATSGWSQSS